MLSPYFVCSPCSPQGLEIDLCVPIFDPIFDPKLKGVFFPVVLDMYTKGTGFRPKPTVSDSYLRLSMI